VGITEADGWSFAIADQQAPIVTSFEPVGGAADVAPATDLIIKFNENIKAGTGNITIWQGTTVIQTIAVTSPQVIIANHVVTIDPPTDLPSEASLSIHIAETALTDESGNKFAGISNATTWSFTIADNTVPILTNLSPADDATAVAATANLILTFSEPVKKGSGVITLAQGTTSQAIDVTSPSVSISGNTVTIDPADFPSGAAVSVTIPSGVFTDRTNNAFAGILTNTAWNFTVADNTAPTVTALSPADNAINVPVNSNLVLTFSEPVKKGAGSIIINQGATSQTIDVSSAAVVVSENTVTIDPADFTSGAAVYVQIAPGTFTDPANNSYGGIFATTAWNFTVADNIAPILTSFTPADNATTVAPDDNLVIVFSEPVRKGTGVITIDQGTTSQTIDVGSAAVTIAGNTVSINPSDFPSGAIVNVQMPAGVFEDLTGNPYAGIANATTWNFTTADTVAPLVSAFNPLNKATNVATTANLVITFNEPIRKGVGNIIVNQGGSSQVIDVNSTAVTIADNMATINPADFPSGADINIQLSSGVFEDINGNDFAGISNTTTWNFTVADNTNPVVASFSPADNATAVPLNANLIITFSEPVQQGTGVVTINQGSTSQSVEVSSTAVTISGNTVTINPPADFPAGVNIYVQVPAGAFTDASNNAFAGFTDASTWNFSTADTQGPGLVTLSPENGAIGMSPGTNLSMTFDETVQKGAGNISFYQGTTLLQTIEVNSAAISVSGTTVTIDPLADLPSAATVSVQMAPGVFKDLSGNNYAGIATAATWSFTLSDNVPPLVTDFSPVTNVVDVPPTANLVLTFDETVKKGTGTITINRGGSSQTINVANTAVTITDNVVTIDPTDFPSGATVSVTITAGAFTDLSNNPFAGITNATTWQFKVADVSVPTVVSLTPPDNATAVAANANLVISFSEPVKKGTGTITIYQNGTPQAISITSSAITVSGNEVTINPPVDFTSNAAIYVIIPASAITDLSNNTFEGITDPTAWNFTVADNIPPTVTALTPPDNATGVAPTSNLALTFTEPVKKGAGSIIISQGGAVQTIDIASPAVTVSGNTVTINPTDFPSGTDVSVLILSGVITDLANNPYAGITDATAWNFSVGDVNAPAILGLVPADNQVNVATSTNLIITFSEPVKKGTGVITFTQGSTTQTIDVTSPGVTISSSLVVIDPPADFPPGATVSVQMPAGVFTDLTNNVFAGLASPNAWNFTVVDNAAPTTATLTPADGAVNVSPNTNLTITFSEVVKKGVGTITVNQGTTSQLLDVADPSVLVSGNTVTISPPLDLPMGVSVYVQISPGAFTDQVNNPFAGITNTTTWNFTVADPVAPSVTALSPLDNAVGVANTENLVITFTEPVKKGSGVITINQGATSQSINVSSVDVTISGNTVTINPPANFPSGDNVFIQIPSGAFTDLANNSFAGITGPDEWNFKVADLNAPFVTSLDPTDNATGVAVNSNLTMVFNEPVKKGSGSITIQQGTSTQVIDVTNLNVVVSGNTVTIDPPADFPSGASVNVRMPAGVFGDLENNAYPGISDPATWNFILEDIGAPLVTALSPIDNSTSAGVGANLVLTFNEPVKKGAGSITINQGGAIQTIDVTSSAVTISGNTVTINPPANFPSGVNVYVEMPAGIFTDLANNVFAGIIDAATWNFSVSDVIAPTITSLSPPDNATGVGTGSNLVLTFSEPVKKGAGNIIINQGSSSQTIDVNSAAVTIANNIVTIDPPANFPSGANVNVLMFSGAITDLSNNPYAGITDASTWNFSVGDVSAPTVTTLLPADEEANVAVNTNLVLNFSEPVKKGTGYIVINYGSTSQLIDVTNATVSISGSTVVINPPVDFPSGSSVNVQIQAGVFTDFENNAYAGITDANTWNFTVADVNAPAVTALSPPDDAMNVELNRDLVMTFNEPVKKGTGSLTIYQGTSTQVVDVNSPTVSVSGNTVTIDPPNDFPSGAAIYVLMPAGVFTDLENNKYPGINNPTNWNFTAVDINSPIISALSPADNANNTQPNTNLIMTFSEPVKKGTGAITIKVGNTTQTINVGSPQVTVTNNIVTINPADFPSGAFVHVEMPAGIFTDLTNNVFAGITDTTTWNFAVVDISAPIVTAFTPANNATQVSASSDLVITFNEPVKKGTGSITINQGATSQIIPVSSSQITITDREVTINAADFPSRASVAVLIPSSAFTDLDNNAYAGISDFTTWNFTVADIAAPVVIALAPSDNTQGVEVSSNLVMTFNEPVKKGTGSITINLGSSNQTIPVTSSQVTINGNVVTIDPTDFPSATAVAVQVPAGSFTDLDNNAFAGIIDATTWNFITTDIAAPVATKFSPSDESVNVGAAVNLVITFSEPVKKGTGYVLLHKGGVDEVIQVPDPAISISEDGLTVTIDPKENLPYATAIKVEIAKETFTDLTGNAYAGISNATTWNFTTAPPPDLTAPVISTLLPSDNALNVAPTAKLVITFNEPVQKGSGTININIGTQATSMTLDVSDPAVVISENVVTITPPSSFPYSASVNIRITDNAFVDATGNSFAGIKDGTTWNFAIAPPPDNAAPQMIAVTPEDNATGITASTNLTIIFSEEIKKGVGNIIINQGVGNQEIDVSSTAVSVSGTTVTINPPKDFPLSAGISIQIASGVFTDLSGNPYVGIQDGTTWNFIVASPADQTPPTLLTFTPADEATQVPENTDLVMTFDEPVQKGIGYILINQGSTTQSIDVNTSSVSIINNTVTINASNFPSGSSIYVLMQSSVFTDLSGNSFSGISSPTTWNFKVEDNTAPLLANQIPADNATGVATNSNLVFTFNEPVRKVSGVITLQQGNSAQTIDVNAANVTISGNTVIINPADFPFNSDVSVLIPRGVFEDLAGNSFAGITDPFVWNFSVANYVDRTPPAVALFLPKDEATKVPVNANLVIKFNESVQKGSGEIRIYQEGSNPISINVASDLVSVSDSTVTINPKDDFPFEAQVSILVPPSSFLDLANNSFVGIEDYFIWNFTVAPVPPLEIVDTRGVPIRFNANETTTNATIVVNKYPVGTVSSIIYRGISQEKWTKEDASVNGLNISAKLAKTQFDQIGLEYFFELSLTTGATVVSDTFYTYITYAQRGLLVPDIQNGSQKEDYQIISIPLNLRDNPVSAVFEDDFGSYDPRKWRLFHYQDTILGNVEYRNNNFIYVEPGLGYWLITRDSTRLNTGEGTTLEVHSTKPYQLELQKGWNQIGNPYNFAISWTDVKAYNNNPAGLGNPKIYEQGYQESDVLRSFRGAFVFAEEKMSVNIPVLKNNTVNVGRKGNVNRIAFHEGAQWQVNFTLQGKDLQYNLGGVGMHPNARFSKDQFDDLTVPRFVRFLEMNFYHPEYFEHRFTKDIIPVQENYTWEFTVASSQHDGKTSIAWDNYFADTSPDKKLVLFDVQTNKVIDLRTQSQYEFQLGKQALFRVYYGSPEYIAATLKPAMASLGVLYPNPFVSTTTIPFAITESAKSTHVLITIHSNTGEQVAVLKDAWMNAGIYQIEWDGKHANGSRLPVGMYFCRMEVEGDKGRQAFNRKVIIQ
jgi:methionine-rich copper-binding protein CopC